MEKFMFKWTVFISAILIFLPQQLSAGSIEFIGTLPIVLSDEDLNKLTVDQQTVYVQHLRLDDSAQQILRERVENNEREQDIKTILNSSMRVNLGMNNTPVLNQGAHGSCITFAMTAALDAILGKGDYISQLCSLELGAYLERKGYIEHSGWDGSFGSSILRQIAQYGIVSKFYQKEFGCAGVKQYPLNNQKSNGSPMSISEYSAVSESMSEFASWENLLDVDEAYSRNHNPSSFLKRVKKHVREGSRVAFGMLLDVEIGHAGALGKYQKKFDTWVLTPRIVKDIKKGTIQAGHEMLIFGYDDNAEVVYKGEVVGKGVFLVRNSWGSTAGDMGNYYVSYDYFKALCDEAQVLVSIK